MPSMQVFAEQDPKRQEQIDTEAQQNCLNAINQLQTGIVRGGDEQTRRFCDFVHIASSFASIYRTMND